MAKRTRWLVLASLAVIALLAFGYTAITPGPSPAGKRAPLEDAADNSDSEADDDAALSPRAQSLTVAPGLGEIVPPKKKSASTPAAPPSTPATPAEPAQPSVDPEYQRYLDDTRATVLGNVPSLNEAADAVMRALAASDRIALASMLAPGEGDQLVYLGDLAVKYPAIQQTSQLNTVNIYSAGGVTVYTAYRLVRWEDAGVVSQHTIPIPLRFVGSQWQLTTLTDTGLDPQFVQAVTL